MDSDFDSIVGIASYIWKLFSNLRTQLPTTAIVILGLTLIHLGSIVLRRWEMTHCYEIEKRDRWFTTNWDEWIGHLLMLFFKIPGYLLLLCATIEAFGSGKYIFASCVAAIAMTMAATPFVFSVGRAHRAPSSTQETVADRAVALQLEILLFSVAIFLCNLEPGDLSVWLVFATCLVLLLYDFMYFSICEEKTWKDRWDHHRKAWPHIAGAPRSN